MESAQVRERQRQEILDARPTDTKLFYRLINKQRGNVRHCVNELSANGEVYKADGDILTGWRDHFMSLATPSDDAKFDMKYSRIVSEEIPIIMDICEDTLATTITTEQAGKAVESLNRGKAPDFFGVTAEHFVYGGEALVEAATNIINSFFGFGKVTEALKIGTPTPVFKKKGSCTDAKNYRGITVFPVITQILETVLRDLIQPCIEQQQTVYSEGSLNTLLL